MSVADDLLDIDFGEAADVDIGGLGDDFNLMSGYQEIIEHSDEETQTKKRFEVDDVRIFCFRQYCTTKIDLTQTTQNIITNYDKNALTMPYQGQSYFRINWPRIN